MLQWIETAIGELRALLKKIKNLTVNLPAESFAKLYEKQSAKIDYEPVKEHAAIFRRFIKWNGHILIIDKENYGKYVGICDSVLSPDELMLLFQFERMLSLIHEEMMNLPPEECGESRCMNLRNIFLNKINGADIAVGPVFITFDINQFLVLG